MDLFVEKQEQIDLHTSARYLRGFQRCIGGIGYMRMRTSVMAFNFPAKFPIWRYNTESAEIKTTGRNICKVSEVS